jgi:DNA polymerase III subunit delta'
LNGSDSRPRLIGQPRAEEILARALARDRVSHAYLFVGPAGVGKTTAAILLAQAVNCDALSAWRLALGEAGPSQPSAKRQAPSAASGSELAPCGRCESCLRITAGTHPDVHVIVPQSKTGQNVSVDQMRDTRRDASLRPSMGRRKVYIVPNAELMNAEAANTLLKTLEEPSDFVTLVLIAPSVSSVLPTIQSRCQLVRFGLTSPAVIQAALQERFGLPEETAAPLARAAGGRVGIAFAWAADAGVLEQRNRALELLREAEERRQAARRKPGQQVAALRLAEAFRELAPGGGPGSAANTRSALTTLLDLALEYYRDLLLLSVGAPESALMVTDPGPLLREQAAGTGPETLLQAIETVVESQQFLERNVAPQLVLERMFARLIGEPA